MSIRQRYFCAPLSVHGAALGGAFRPAKFLGARLVASAGAWQPQPGTPVAWDPGIARPRVSRDLTVIDGGKIVNHRTGRNQILGAVVMGIGMALFEETIHDPRNAKPLNNILPTTWFPPTPMFPTSIAFLWSILIFT